MKIIDPTIVKKYLDEAFRSAEKASCTRSKCGAVIVSDSEIIGRGFNSPPGDLESQRRCDKKDELGPGFKSDKTCCIHAEWRAIFDALKNMPAKVPGSSMYFARSDKNGANEINRPYCTICSKMILDVGIKEMILEQAEGLAVFSAEEYNDASYGYKG